MAVWDVTTPLGTESKSLGDDRIREAKAAVQNALLVGAASGVEAVFPGANPSTNPIYRPRFPKGAGGARPASGENGLYVNETTKTIDRDNGVSWEAIATLIPSGTVAIFYQAAAPLGWTKIVTQNDKALRVVSGGTGGGSGGTNLVSAGLAHAHTVNGHTHGLASHTHSVPNHTHQLDDDGAADANAGGQLVSAGGDGSAGQPLTVSTGGGARSATLNRTKNSGAATSGAAAGNTDSTSPATDSQAPVLAYIDVIICSKD